MIPSRSREDRKNPQKYLSDDQLRQEYEQIAQQNRKEKQLKELYEKEQLLKHYKNYQMGENKQIENDEQFQAFLAKREQELSQQQNQFAQNEPDLYENRHQKVQEMMGLGPERRPEKSEKLQELYNNIKIEQNQNFMFQNTYEEAGGNVKKDLSQGELERQRRIKLREEERKRRLMGIENSVYGQGNQSSSLEDKPQYSDRNQTQGNQLQSQEMNRKQRIKEELFGGGENENYNERKSYQPSNQQLNQEQQHQLDFKRINSPQQQQRQLQQDNFIKAQKVSKPIEGIITYQDENQNIINRDQKQQIYNQNDRNSIQNLSSRESQKRLNTEKNQQHQENQNNFADQFSHQEDEKRERQRRYKQELDQCVKNRNSVQENIQSTKPYSQQSNRNSEQKRSQKYNQDPQQYDNQFQQNRIQSREAEQQPGFFDNFGNQKFGGRQSTNNQKQVLDEEKRMQYEKKREYADQLMQQISEKNVKGYDNASSPTNRGSTQGQKRSSAQNQIQEQIVQQQYYSEHPNNQEQNQGLFSNDENSQKQQDQEKKRRFKEELDRQVEEKKRLQQLENQKRALSENSNQNSHADLHSSQSRQRSVNQPGLPPQHPVPGHQNFQKNRNYDHFQEEFRNEEYISQGNLKQQQNFDNFNNQQAPQTQQVYQVKNDNVGAEQDYLRRSNTERLNYQAQNREDIKYEDLNVYSRNKNRRNTGQEQSQPENTYFNKTEQENEERKNKQRQIHSEYAAELQRQIEEKNAKKKQEKLIEQEIERKEEERIKRENEKAKLEQQKLEQQKKQTQFEQLNQQVQNQEAKPQFNQEQPQFQNRHQIFEQQRKEEEQPYTPQQAKNKDEVKRNMFEQSPDNRPSAQSNMQESDNKFNIKAQRHGEEAQQNPYYDQQQQNNFQQQQNYGAYPQQQVYTQQGAFQGGQISQEQFQIQILMQQNLALQQIIQQNMYNKAVQEQIQIQKIEAEEKMLLEQYKEKIKEDQMRKLDAEQQIQQLKKILEERQGYKMDYSVVSQIFQRSILMNKDQSKQLQQSTTPNLNNIQFGQQSALSQFQGQSQFLKPSQIQALKSPQQLPQQYQHFQNLQNMSEQDFDKSLPGQSEFVAQNKDQLEKSFLKDYQEKNKMMLNKKSDDHRPSQFQQQSSINQPLYQSQQQKSQVSLDVSQTQYNPSQANQQRDENEKQQQQEKIRQLQEEQQKLQKQCQEINEKSQLRSSVLNQDIGENKKDWHQEEHVEEIEFSQNQLLRMQQSKLKENQSLPEMQNDVSKNQSDPIIPYGIETALLKTDDYLQEFRKHIPPQESRGSKNTQFQSPNNYQNMQDSDASNLQQSQYQASNFDDKTIQTQHFTLTKTEQGNFPFKTEQNEQSANKQESEQKIINPFIKKRNEALAQSQSQQQSQTKPNNSQVQNSSLNQSTRQNREDALKNVPITHSNLPPQPRSKSQNKREQIQESQDREMEELIKERKSKIQNELDEKQLSQSLEESQTSKIQSELRNYQQQLQQNKIQQLLKKQQQQEEIPEIIQAEDKESSPLKSNASQSNKKIDLNQSDNSNQRDKSPQVKEIQMTDAQYNYKQSSLILPEDELDDEKVEQFIDSNENQQIPVQQQLQKHQNEEAKQEWRQEDFQNELDQINNNIRQIELNQQKQHKNLNQQNMAEVSHLTTLSAKSNGGFKKPKTVDIFSKRDTISPKNLVDIIEKRLKNEAQEEEERLHSQQNQPAMMSSQKSQSNRQKIEEMDLQNEEQEVADIIGFNNNQSEVDGLNYQQYPEQNRTKYDNSHSQNMGSNIVYRNNSSTFNQNPLISNTNTYIQGRHKDKSDIIINRLENFLSNVEQNDTGIETKPDQGYKKANYGHDLFSDDQIFNYEKNQNYENKKQQNAHILQAVMEDSQSKRFHDSQSNRSDIKFSNPQNVQLDQDPEEEEDQAYEEYNSGSGSKINNDDFWDQSSNRYQENASERFDGNKQYVFQSNSTRGQQSNLISNQFRKDGGGQSSQNSLFRPSSQNSKRRTSSQRYSKDEN